MRLFLFIAVAWIFSFSSTYAASPAVEIGKAVKVKNSVDLITNQGAYEIVVGTAIHTQETVTTGKKSTSQFTMTDDTRLAVGPNSQLLLDKFVYDPNPKNREVVIKGLKGALRFVTGNNPSDTYTINTPTAVIGVRGTMFDLYVAKQDKTIVALLSGKINVCPPGSNLDLNRCRDLKTPGKFLEIDSTGRIRITNMPNRATLGGVSFVTAFPFLAGRRLRGKLAAPRKLRWRIRRRAGLERPIKRKKPIRRHNRRRSNAEDQGEFVPPRHRRSVSIREDGGGYLPPARHRKIISRYDYEDTQRPRRPRHKKAISRYQTGDGGTRPRHRKRTSRRQQGGYDVPPYHRKSVSRRRTRHKKSVSRIRGGIYIPIPLPGRTIKRGTGTID